MTVDAHADHRYARIERERKYLLRALPINVERCAYRDIIDRYLPDARLRLREVIFPSGERTWKLTQKYPVTLDSLTNTIITNIYLSEAEFTVFSALPSQLISKRRFIYEFDRRRYAIDAFRDRLEGLILAETECETDAELADLPFPVFALRDVTEDPRFTGGALSKSAISDIAALQ